MDAEASAVVANNQEFDESTDTSADESTTVIGTNDDEEIVVLEKKVPESERIAHQTKDEITAEREAQLEAIANGEYAETDIFAWANNLFQFKKELKIELFLINKNNVVYHANLDKEIQKQLQPLFIDELLDYVLQGAGAGMVVRGFEEAEAEENVLQRTEWVNVEKLCEVMHWIRTQEKEIETFVEEEHDLKRLKGVLARCSHPSMPNPFYIIKQLPSAQMLKGDGAWMVKGKQFVPFEAAAALKLPSDNQLLILEQDLYVFSQPKLDRLFGYNAKKNSIAEKKVAEIEARFRLSFADGMDMQSLVKGSKPTINKLQKIEITDDLKQDAVMDHAEELGVDLMLDDTGAIIIENTKDLNKFVNLLNDDYMESQLTGIRYEIRAKRQLKPPKDDAAAAIAL